MPKTYQNYVFDLYGTLVDIHTVESSPILWKRFAQYWSFKSGQPIPPKALQREYARLCDQAAAQKLQELRAQGIPGPEEFDLLPLWQQLFQLFHITLTPQEATDAACLFRALSLKKLTLFPGAKEVLQALRDQGKKLYLLTNAQVCFTRPELAYLGLSQSFDQIFYSSDAGVRKPSPAFFDLLWQAGLNPAETLMIGNDDQCDCHGAHAAHMDSRYLQTPQSPPRTRPLPPTCQELPNLWALLET